MGLVLVAGSIYASGLTFFPSQTHDWVTVILPAAVEGTEASWRKASALGAGLALAFLIGACLLPWTRSAATYGAFFLFGVITSYGASALLIRRWQYVPVALLLFLA